MPSDLELSNRLKKLNLCVSNRLTPEVKAYIHGYVERKKEKTEDMLTRTLIYFPVSKNILIIVIYPKICAISQ